MAAHGTSNPNRSHGRDDDMKHDISSPPPGQGGGRPTAVHQNRLQQIQAALRANAANATRRDRRSIIASLASLLKSLPPVLHSDPDAEEVAHAVVDHLADLRVIFHDDSGKVVKAGHLAGEQLDDAAAEALSSCGDYGWWEFVTKMRRRRRVSGFRQKYAGIDMPETSIISGLIRSEETAIIGGPTKANKSCAAADLIAAILTATPFLGLNVGNRKRAILVTAENSAAEYQTRIDRSIASRNSMFDSRFHFGELGDCLFISDQPSLARTRQGRADLLGFVRDFGADVVLLDPFNRISTAKDSTDLVAVGQALDRLCRPITEAGAAVIIVHHFSKSSLGIGDEPTLAHLSGAGVAEYARSWLLLNRKSPYTGPRSNELLLTWGSCHGDAGSGKFTLDEEDGQLLRAEQTRAKRRRGL